ncbi:hypothetical protein FACS189472_17970 [Alphaproteobacteria bacterium]|nr:hypothetical protein FACS189472_17970 [Alphaproteobacteria bacterium]
MNSVLYSALQSRGIPSPKEVVAPQALLLLKPPQRYKHVSHTFVKVAKTLVHSPRYNFG